MVGDGNNFVRTMARLADDGVCPSVVHDQIGRLTFTEELVRATRHLLDTDAAYSSVLTGEYAAGKALAPRPANSVLDLAKLQATGFESEDAMRALTRYLTAPITGGE